MTVWQGAAAFNGAGGLGVSVNATVVASASFAGAGGLTESDSGPVQFAGAVFAGSGAMSVGVAAQLAAGAQFYGASAMSIATIGKWYDSVVFSGQGGLSFRFSGIVAAPPLPASGVFPISKMRKAALTEAVSILQAGLAALLANSPVATSAELRQACGDLSAAAASEIAGGTVANDLFNCFDLAVAAGATASSMAMVRAIALAMTPVYVPGQLLATAMVRFCLIEEAQLVSAQTFTSRDDVDAAIALYGDAFDAAIDYASINNDQDAYMALIALEGALINNLATTARPLPQMVSYTFAKRMPALWMAQRLYQDPTRALQLVQENKVVHPLFCPRSIRALSS